MEAATLKELLDRLQFYCDTHHDEWELPVIFDGLRVHGKFQKQKGEHPCVNMY